MVSLFPSCARLAAPRAASFPAAPFHVPAALFETYSRVVNGQPYRNSSTSVVHLVYVSSLHGNQKGPWILEIRFADKVVAITPLHLAASGNACSDGFSFRAL